MRVEYELDQWDWQGTTRSIEIDPFNYEGLSAEEIKQAVYEDIRQDAEQNLHLVYEENLVAQKILNALAKSEDDDDD